MIERSEVGQVVRILDEVLARKRGEKGVGGADLESGHENSQHSQV